MAELTPQERLQPSLLDRLTDDAPGQQQEGRDQRVLTMSRLREGVLRDLSWLLNTVHLGASEDLSRYPEVARSVVNYGIPDLTGMAIAGMDLNAIQRAVRQAILDFEPRLTPSSLQVTVQSDADHMSHKALTFLIQSELWAQPIPLNLYLKTEVDLDTGSFSVSESLA